MNAAGTPRRSTTSWPTYFANQEDIYSIYIVSNVDNRILAGYPRNDLLGQYYQMTREQRAAADLGMGGSVWMGLSSNHNSVAWGRVINSLTTLRPSRVLHDLSE